MYPVGGRPVIDYLVERMRASDCDEVIVVTRPEKRDVVEHAGRSGLRVVLAYPASLGESIRSGLVGLDDADTALLGFPDSLWEPVDGYRAVVDALGDDVDVSLGIFGTSTDMRRFEPVLFGADDRIASIQFKPDEPRSQELLGCAAARVRSLREMSGDEPGRYFDALARRGRVVGVRLSDVYIDLGTPEGLVEAAAYARA